MTTRRDVERSILARSGQMYQSGRLPFYQWSIPMTDDQSEKNTNTAPRIKHEQIPHELTVAEFNYIGQSTNQSSEDRARVSNYYLVTIGAAIAAILSEKLINSD